MLWSHRSHETIYSSAAWRTLNPVDRAHIILVAERVKPMAYCGLTELRGVRNCILDGLDIVALEARGKIGWEWSSMGLLVFPSRTYTVCNSAKTLKVFTGGLSIRLEGRLLGYPRCCVEEYTCHTYEKEFTPEVIRSVGRWAFRFALEAVGLFLDGKSLPREFNYLMPSQTPHSVTCLPSLKLLRRWASVIERHDPEAAKTLVEINRRLFAKLQAMAAKLRQRGFTSSAQLRRGYVHRP